MSDAVGYNLENQSYKGLHPLLKRDLGLKIEDRLIRRYLPHREKRLIPPGKHLWLGEEKRQVDMAEMYI